MHANVKFGTPDVKFFFLLISLAKQFAIQILSLNSKSLDDMH